MDTDSVSSGESKGEGVQPSETTPSSDTASPDSYPPVFSGEDPVLPPGATAHHTPGATDPNISGPGTTGVMVPETPGPSEPETPGPTDPETPVPADPETPGPADPETPGPSEPETPGAASDTGSLRSRASVLSLSPSVSDDLPPLHTAASAFDVAAVSELLSQTQQQAGAAVLVQETDRRGRNAAHTVVKSLTALERWDPGRTAAKSRLIEIVALLVQAGLDINAVDYSGRKTPLHMVSSHPDMADTIKALLSVGSKVNLVGGKEQRTALHMAVSAKLLKNAEALVDHGADPNAKDRTGKAPLHLAAAGKRSLSVLQLLLNVNADANQQDTGGRSPLHVAAKAGRPELVKELLHGTSTNPGADVNLRDFGGMAAIHIAAVHDVTGKIIEELLRKTPDVNAVDWIRGETALHKAVTLNMHENIKILCRTKTISVNIQDVLGETPLHKAFDNKELWLWQTLLKARGADVKTKDHLGQTPLFKALKSKNMTGQCVVDALAWELTEKYTYY